MKIKKINIRGLSLIEVLVTIVITSIGLMGLLSLQMQAFRATSDTGSRTHATLVLNDIINRIHANKVASASYATTANNVCIPSIAGAAATEPSIPSKVCGSYHTGTALVDSAANCTNEELAAWDLYEVTCGSPKADNFQGSAISYIPDAQLLITCVNLPCAHGKPLIAELRWRAKVDNESITGAARSANSGSRSILIGPFTP